MSSQEQFPHYIEFRQVSKTFDRPVLVDCSFYVDAGETVAIIGRSGVGKSVTLSHIMGFHHPDSGRIIVSYQDITRFHGGSTASDPEKSNDGLPKRGSIRLLDCRGEHPVLSRAS